MEEFCLGFRLGHKGLYIKALCGGKVSKIQLTRKIQFLTDPKGAKQTSANWGPDLTLVNYMNSTR